MVTWDIIAVTGNLNFDATFTLVMMVGAFSFLVALLVNIATRA